MKKMKNTDLLQMTKEQLERVVKYYEIRSFHNILTEKEIEREKEATELLNSKTPNHEQH